MEPKESTDIELRLEGCGDVIKTYREKAGLTVRSLADKAKCSHSALTKIENNQLSLSLAVIESIAKAIDVKAGTILLTCLKKKFPKLQSTKAGSIVATYLER
jgi:transcriptional regulator with XRE-family HTH domain